MSTIEPLFEIMGIEITPLIHVAIIIVAYLVFGFGLSKFNDESNRFHEKETGRFISWQLVLIYGIFIDSLLFLIEWLTNDSVNFKSFFIGLLVCVIITIVLGYRTHQGSTKPKRQ